MLYVRTLIDVVKVTMSKTIVDVMIVEVVSFKEIFL